MPNEVIHVGVSKRQRDKLSRIAKNRKSSIAALIRDTVIERWDLPDDIKSAPLRRAFTTDEDEFIWSNWNPAIANNLKDISEALGRNPSSVHNRARTLGLITD
jgi:hypothetical protein